MPQTVKIPVHKRQATGKGVARKLRAQGLIPGVIYGPGTPSTPLALEPKPIIHLLESGSAENVLIELETDDGDKWLCLLKDYQLDPVHAGLLHVDFYAVKTGVLLSVRVPVHLVGEAPGVKEGGVLEFLLRELEIECYPKDIPESIDVNISELGIGDFIQVKDLQLKEGIRITEDPDAVIVLVAAGTEEEAEEEEAEEAVLMEEPEPEVIRRGKKEEEEEAETES